ncbi:MAG TPA: type II toxin-antitoxin system RelE/ParE family toxin [Allosphingosinicella sp.]|jgi:addiction module RelE/StbE family toxin
MQLVWRAEALADLKSIVEYIADRNAPAALRLRSAIEACADRLRERPFMYRPGRVQGTREAVVHPNYILIYEIGAAAVEIMAVVHARRQYP